LLNFKSKRLGLYQNLGTVKFFNTEKIQMIKSKPLEEDPINQKNVLAFDLSEINDFTVVSKCWPLKDGTFYIHHYYFLPELTIYDVYTKSKRKINHLLPDWVDKGLIETCPG
jgi:phage terminase large subunit-like protein